VAWCPHCAQENPAGARFCNGCGAALASEWEERRKPATLLFCDVADSTGLGESIDAEAVRELMLAYFREMRAAIESHGGTVEKFIGDAVLGVFGVPVAHEDDALRAVRAAAEMGRRLTGLNAEFDRRFGARLALRIGINTGEVVAGDASARESFVSGDAVNIAARLQQAAPPGGVLLGGTTFALVEQAVEAEALPPLALKGKAAPVAAYRLLRVGGDEESPRDAVPFVAREAELVLLASLLERVRTSGKPVRALIIGEAGVGKSRLVRTALARAGGGVRVLAVRCLPYGESITYFPLVQLLRQAARIGESQDRLGARSRVEALFAGEPDADSVTATLAQVLGLADSVASAAEIAWAARRLAEILARERPLVLVVDDLQWAKEPFVELLEGVAERGRAAILVLCLARPEFDWRGSGWEPDLRLQPLSDQNAQRLVASLATARPIAEQAHNRLLAAAGGNPLFLEELVAFLDLTGEGPAEIPPTLEALLAARLDGLEADERRTLECASVEGQVFHRGAVVALATPGERATVDSSLARLSENALVRVASSSFLGEQAFQFHHLLIRDAAYRGTPKRRRADLHLQFAGWLEQKLGTRIAEAAEIVGHHLEQTWRLRRELGPLEDETRAVGARAAELLAGAARRALARGDAAAALQLLTRACALAASPHTRIELELERGTAAREAGEFALGESVLAAVEREARAAAMLSVAARAGLELALLELHLRPDGSGVRLRQVGEAALASFEATDDERGRALALSVLAQERWMALDCAEGERLLERALVHAQRLRDDRLTAAVLVALARAVLFGPRPASEAARRCEDLLADARRIGPTTEASISMMLAVLEATQGRAERARELASTSTAMLEEIAPGPRVAIARQYAGFTELILGDRERAERELRKSFELLERLGERAVASTVAALLARALVELDRGDEAELFSSLALDWSGREDIATQAYARSAHAGALVARGAKEEARQQALEAVELSSASDFTNQRGDAAYALAVVLRACGDDVGARRAAAEAHAFFVAKENLVLAERAAAFSAG
jgi:class 3 adenylate cyclase